jgi:hypothetical protein
LFHGLTAVVGLGLLIEVSRSHSGHTTLGRTPVDERLARCRDLYFTTHNSDKREKDIPPAGIESAIPESEWPQTYALDRAATGYGHNVSYNRINLCY